MAVALTSLIGLVTGLLATPAPARAETGPASQYVPLDHLSVLNTRTSTGPTQGAKLAPHASLTFDVAGVGSIPAKGITAVALNINVHEADQSGWVTIYPSDAPTKISTLTFAASQSTTGFDLTRMSGTGKISIVNNSDGAAHFTVSARGYYLDAGANTGQEYHAVNPAYLVDTRFGIGSAVAPLQPGATVTVPITGQNDVPSNAVGAVALNILAGGKAAGGYLSVYPSDTADPSISSLNYEPDELNTNFAIPKLSASGTLKITNHGTFSVDVSVTLRGYFSTADGSGSTLTPTDPVVALSTLNGTGTPGNSTAAVKPNQSITFKAVQGAPAGLEVNAVAVNINARRPTSSGYLSVYPKGLPDPNLPSVSYALAQTTNGFDTPDVGQDSEVMVTNHSDGEVHIDVTIRGYLATAAAKDVTQVYDAGTDDDSEEVNYWTPERMQEADDQMDADVAASGLVPGGMESEAVTEDTIHDEPTDGPPDITAQSTFSFTAHHKQIGKFYFPYGSGTKLGCSGIVVGWNLVLSAAHCFDTHGYFGSKFVFAPMWDNKKSPYGVWGIKKVYLDNCRKGGNPQCDWAIVVLKRKNGSTLYSKYGINGYNISGNPIPRDQWVSIVGYPGGDRHPRRCNGRSNPALLGDGHYYWDVNCGDSGMKAGVSGSPWVYYDKYNFHSWVVAATFGGYHEGGYGQWSFAAIWGNHIYALWSIANSHM
ncbi:V8-like Glu-specific endopeptidase [Actinomadura rupiterrae]|nr:V8-like Glu-specific endopeptidase [Actinomadura rupiterrae]